MSQPLGETYAADARSDTGKGQRIDFSVTL